MPTQKDPEEVETKHLHRFANLSGARALEIGCGDGRLTWRYAASTGQVAATDPDPQRLALALQTCPPALRPKVAFAQTKAEALPFPGQTFDLAIFAWSL